MNSLIPSHIQVTVVRARDLALKSKSVNSDVFAVIQVEKEKEVTHLLPRHSCPQWNQSFDIPLMSLDSSVDITVKQKTKFTEEFLGYTRVPFNHLSISRRPRQNWHKLGPRPGKTSSKLRGDILISLSFLYKWDSVETQTPPTSPSFETGDRKMLRRTKSEHRGGAKQERAVKSKGSIFGRTKSKKNSQVFEDSDDFVALSIRSSGDPPTPPQSERRKQLLLSSSSPDGTDSYDASTEERSSSPNRLLFTEATHQLEKTGIVDLWRADPVMRREAVKQHIRGNELSKLGSSSSVKKDSSFDSSYEEEATRHSASTPTNTPTRSNTITYRAKSTPRRRERTNSFGNPSSAPKTPDEKQGVTPHTSNTSLESNTSEYYSGSSSVTTTPSTCNTLVSCDSETTPTNTSIRPKDVAPSVSLRKVSKDDTKASPTLASHSPPKRGKLKRGTTVDTSSSYSTLPHRHSNAHASDHSFSTLQRNPTRDGERPKPRNPQHQYLSAGDNNIKRHSADIEQILKLSSLSQGRNDGLENVLNTGQLKQLLQKRNSRGKGGEAGVSRTLPKSQPNSASSLASHQPLSPPVNNKDDVKDTPTVNKDMPAANEATPTLTNDTPIDVPHHDKVTPTLSNETHPQQENENQAEVNEDPLHNGPLSNGDDHVTSTHVTHENPKVSVPILVETPISSGSTTPSRMSPPLTSTDVTRETTPSPDHEEREGEDDTDDGKEEEGSMRVEAKKKHTVEYKRSFDGGNNFQPFHPLPPSVVAVSASNSSSSSPSHYAQKKYSSTTDITTLLNQCKEIVSTGNKMELSSVTGTHSATTSGRTSPAIVEEEEEEGQKPGEAGKENATPISTTPSSTSPPTVQSAPKPSTSVSRRKTGGGLKRTLSLYQENRKQAVAPSKGKRTLPNIDATPARPLRRNSSSTSEKSKRSGEATDKPIANLLPLPPPSLLQSSKHLPTSTAASTVTAVSVMGGKTSLGASFTASKSSSNASKSTVTKQHDESDKMVTPNGLLSSHETHHSSSQSSTSTPTLPPVTSHFTLPPPPPPMEELGQSDLGTVVGSRGREVVTSVSTDVTSSTSSYSEAESSCTSSSEVDEEETTVEDYRDWSKEALISELLRTKSKLKRKTMELYDTKSYLEILLVKVMDSNPELLLSDSSS